MPKLRVHCFTMSLDGYGAGPLHLQLASRFDHSSCTV